MTPSVAKASAGEHFLRFLRFSVAGATGFAVQIAIVGVLANWAGMNYLAATAIAVEAAILVNYLWHEKFTWKDRPAMTARERWLRLGKFNAMTSITSIVGSVMITAVLVESFTLSPLDANVIAVVVLGLINFIGASPPRRARGRCAPT